MMPTGLSSIFREIEFLTETWSLHCFFSGFYEDLEHANIRKKLTLKFDQVNDGRNNFKEKRMLLM